MNLFVIILVIGVSLPAWAGGPFQVTTAGVPTSWENQVTLHPEAGICATFTNAQMATKIQDNVAFWEGITGVGINFSVTVGTISVDVNGNNFNDYYVDASGDPGLTDSTNPVVFDDDGEIVDTIFSRTCGQNCHFSVLGFAGPDRYSSDGSTTIDGQAFFNCRCLAGNPNGACTVGGRTITFTEDDLNFTMMHEIGHMIGLDHTQVNQDLAGNCDTSVTGDCNNVPAMYPLSVDAAEQITPTRDDEVALLTVQQRCTIDSTDTECDLEQSTCSVRGTLLDTSGNPVRCADVQARTTNASQTIAVVSGIFAPNQDTDSPPDGYTESSGECLEDCGDFILRGLETGVQYTIHVLPINSSFTGGSGINPCTASPPSTVQTEQIATITAGQCSRGGVINLGEVTTTSSSGDNSGSSSSSGGSSSGSGSSSNTSTITCGLNPEAKGSIPWFFFLPYFLFLIRWRSRFIQ